VGVRAARAAGVPLWVNVDHHVSNTGYGDLVLLDAEAAAVAEMVFPIVTAFQPLDAETAVCLMTALLTDTGSFHYASVTPRSFELAAELVRAGASPMAIFDQVYENRSTSSVRLLGLALTRMTICEDGHVAWTTVTQEMLKEAKATMEESEGIVGALRTVRGIQVAVLFKEEANEISVSLRGVGSVRTNVIAEGFGGGGHAAAAGFTAKAPLDEVVRRTLAAVRRELSAATL
jgi:bifunctional oligoribonuclease and PAP phosphatase NrnA